VFYSLRVNQRLAPGIGRYHERMHAMRLYLINPSNPLVSIANVKESRWNRYRVWKPLSLMVLAGLTPPEWKISVLEAQVLIENWGRDYSPIGFHSALVYKTPAPEAIMRLSEQKSLTLIVVQSFGAGEDPILQRSERTFLKSINPFSISVWMSCTLSRLPTSTPSYP
jgi:hypothetical protein